MTASAAEAAVIAGVEATEADIEAIKRAAAAKPKRRTAAQKRADAQAAEAAARAKEAEAQAKIGTPRTPKPKPEVKGPAVTPNGKVATADVAHGYVISGANVWSDWTDKTRRMVTSDTPVRGWKVGTVIQLHHSKGAQPGVWAAAQFTITAVITNGKVNGEEVPAKVASWPIQK
jgi:hypothetical protein